METAQKERQLYPPLLLSRASQVQSPLITSHCAAVNACCGYRPRAGLASAGRGWETRAGATALLRLDTIPQYPVQNRAASQAQPGVLGWVS